MQVVQMKKQQDKEQVSLRLERRLKTRVMELINRMPYPPTFTQVVESGLEKEAAELELILSGKKRNQ
jgi:hypothetical protein